MIKRKPLLFFALVIAIVALFAASEVMAQDSCIDLQPNIDATYAQTVEDNGYCTHTWTFEGNNVNNIRYVCVLVDKNVVILPDNNLTIGDPCDGVPVGNTQVWDDACETKVVCGTAQVQDTGNYTFSIGSTCGVTSIGLLVEAGAKLGVATCTIDGPAYATPYAGVPPYKVVGKYHGKEYCAYTNPDGTYVPFDIQPPFECDDPSSTVPIDDAFTFGNSGQHKALHVGPSVNASPVALAGNPDECTWICFWGSCCGPIGPSCCLNSTPPCP
jgi:hypothetical protein